MVPSQPIRALAGMTTIRDKLGHCLLLTQFEAISVAALAEARLCFSEAVQDASFQPRPDSPENLAEE
jgi:hypothetical protein